MDILEKRHIQVENVTHMVPATLIPRGVHS